MTSIERKSITEAYLKKFGIPYNPLLSIIDEEEDANIRSAADIAARIVVLLYLNAFAGSEKDKDRIIQFLKDAELWDSVSADEQELFAQEKLLPHQVITITWRAEDIWLLLWCINKVDTMALPAKLCDMNAILDLLPDFFAPVDDFINTATIRSTSDILDMADLMYRMHWAVRDAELKKKRIPANLDPGIVYERHYAINWVIYYEDDWDDVSADT